MDGQPLKGLKAHGFYREMGLLLMTWRSLTLHENIIQFK